MVFNWTHMRKKLLSESLDGGFHRERNQACGPENEFIANGEFCERSTKQWIANWCGDILKAAQGGGGGRGEEGRISNTTWNQ